VAPQLPSPFWFATSHCTARLALPLYGLAANAGNAAKVANHRHTANIVVFMLVSPNQSYA
jgi:hypothetical protein